MTELTTWKVSVLQHKLKISGRKEELARRVYRAMTFRNSDSERDDADDETYTDISHPYIWIPVTTRVNTTNT